MRILMTTDCVGGVWTYSMELSRALAAHDVDVVLATMGPPPSAGQREEAASLWNVQLIESRYKLEWEQNPWEDVRDAGGWLLSLRERQRPDLVHLNGFAHGALGWDLPVVMVAHSCVMSWWQAVKREPAPPAWGRYRQEVRRGLASADAVVAPTGAMLGSIEEHYGRMHERRVIANGRSHERFAPLRKQPFVLSAGRLWDEAKNLSTLQQAAAGIRCEVRVAGEQEMNGQSAIDTSGVTRLGRLTQAEVAQQMARAAIYALPARYEPFGLSVLEAAMSGCALVLGDIPSLREVWRDAATYVNPDDPDALARAINELLDDPVHCAACGEAAALRSIQYTPQRMARQYCELYDQLLRQRLPQAQQALAMLSPEIDLG